MPKAKKTLCGPVKRCIEHANSRERCEKCRYVCMCGQAFKKKQHFRRHVRYWVLEFWFTTKGSQHKSPDLISRKHQKWWGSLVARTIAWATGQHLKCFPCYKSMSAWRQKREVLIWGLPELTTRKTSKKYSGDVTKQDREPHGWWQEIWFEIARKDCLPRFLRSANEYVEDDTSKSVKALWCCYWKKGRKIIENSLIIIVDKRTNWDREETTCHWISKVYDKTLHRANGRLPWLPPQNHSVWNHRRGMAITRTLFIVRYINFSILVSATGLKTSSSLL